MKPGGAVERRDREIIKALPQILSDLSGEQGKRIIGLFMNDPTTLLQSAVSTTREDAEVRREVWFINYYPEYWRGEDPHRTSDHGIWHSRGARNIRNEHGNQMGFMTPYDYRPRRNGGREQGPNLGLREYTKNRVGFNEHSLCIIYEKRPKKQSRRNGEGSSVEQQSNLQITPPLPLMTSAAGPFAAAGLDLFDDFSKNGFGSLNFRDKGWKDSRYDQMIEEDFSD